VREAVLILGFVLMMTLVAQISIRLPGTPVPITGQTFGVLLTGVALGSRRGAASTLVYLGLGSAGLPVFAGWGGGAVWGLASGGYIVGFVFGAYVVGWLVERGWDRWPSLLVAMLLGNAAIYLPGLYQLSFFVPEGKVLAFGLYPFIPGDLLKLYLASVAVPTAWALTLRVRASVAVPTTWALALRLRSREDDAPVVWRRVRVGVVFTAAGFVSLVVWSLLVALKMELDVYDVTDLSIIYWLWLATGVVGLAAGLHILARDVPAWLSWPPGASRGPRRP
jgi:biotin transport system substrate-specific component